MTSKGSLAPNTGAALRLFPRNRPTRFLFGFNLDKKLTTRSHLLVISSIRVESDITASVLRQFSFASQLRNQNALAEQCILKAGPASGFKTKADKPYRRQVAGT